MIKFILEKLSFQLNNALKRIAQMLLESVTKNVPYMQQCVNMGLNTFSAKRLRKQIIPNSVKNIGLLITTLLKDLVIIATKAVAITAEKTMVEPN